MASDMFAWADCRGCYLCKYHVQTASDIAELKDCSGSQIAKYHTQTASIRLRGQTAVAVTFVNTTDRQLLACL